MLNKRFLCVLLVLIFVVSIPAVGHAREIDEISQAPDLQLIIYGDANGDNKISLEDVIEIQLYKAGLKTITPERAKMADLDLSGDADLSDAVIIQQLCAKLINLYPQFGKYDITLGKGEFYTALMTNANQPYNRKVLYISTNESIAEVDSNGKITAKSIGSTSIIVQNPLGKNTQLNITVKAAPTYIKLNCNNCTLVKGEKLDLESYIDEGSAAYKRDFTTSDKKIATVDKHGTVTAKSEGNAVIRCSIYNGLYAECTVNVTSTSARIRKDLDPTKPMIALTFDDGPNSATTGMILDTLKKYNSRATFFVVGTRVYGENKQVLKRAYDMGCEVGSHSYSHQYFSNITLAEAKKEINKAKEIIKDATGAYPTLFRLPGGISVKSYLPYVGAPIINWSVDTRDWEVLNSSAVYNSVMKDSYDGAVVLMHDIYGTTATAAQNAIASLISRGYQLVTVSELAYYKGYKLESGSIYYHFR